MTVNAKIDRSRVYAALLNRFEYQWEGAKVTPEDIAEYLECDLDDVNHHLRELEARRTIRRRRRDGQTFIVPWDGQVGEF